MSESVKLTKKQKKAAAFRGKKGKGREEPLDVPLVDDPEEPEIEKQELPSQRKAKGTDPLSEKPNKKRKREGDVEELPKSKKTKTSEEAEAEDKPPKKKLKQVAQPKFIVFVGNLSYKTSVERIAEHFSVCDPPPTIRQLTSRRKGENGHPNKPEKSKGCAFLEFSKASGLQSALKLHHSDLDGRKINVELSAGGGGKSEIRMKKVKEKNAKLDKHRSSGSETRRGDADAASTAKSRHSTTSGAVERPVQKETWSVARDGEKAGRGGQKHRKPVRDGKHQRGRGQKPFNAWAMSGANAIPVG